MDLGRGLAHEISRPHRSTNGSKVPLLIEYAAASAQLSGWTVVSNICLSQPRVDSPGDDHLELSAHTMHLIASG